MYDENLDIKNKIISDTDILEILEKMNEYLITMKQRYRDNQHYEIFDCIFWLDDNTNLTIKGYENILSIFNTRFSEIRDMHISCSFSYFNGIKDRINSSMMLFIRTHEISQHIKIDNNDSDMKELYSFVKNKILNAPAKYDRVIKKRATIRNKICFALGVIPSIVVCTFLLFLPLVNQIYHEVPVAYPLFSIILGYMVGVGIFNSSLDDLYSPMIPDKYSKYDTSEHKLVYYDDVDKFISCGEVIIGKNCNNLKNRKEILRLEQKYSKYIPIELLVILVISFIIYLF